MEGNMIEDPASCQNLLTKFRERVARIGILESLAEVKRRDLEAEDKDFYFWDDSYYKRIWRETSHMIDETKISEYFPAPATALGMLSIFEALFGIVFEKIDGNYWAEGVELYAVWDDKESGGTFSGYLYLDLYERPGKYAGGMYLSLLPSSPPLDYAS
jgi:metallopeptidase MepB